LLQFRAQFAHGAKERLLCVIDCRALARCDLFESPTFDVLQNERLTFIGREAVERMRKIVAKRLLRVVAFWGDRSRGDREVRDDVFLNLDVELRFTFSNEIDRGIQRDTMNPSVEFSASLKLLASAPRPEQRFLNGICSKVRIARDAQTSIEPAATALFEHALKVVRPQPIGKELKHAALDGRPPERLAAMLEGLYSRPQVGCT